MDWNNRYHQNILHNESNLHIQCDSCQKPKGILLRPRKNATKIHMETQESLKSYSNFIQQNKAGHITFRVNDKEMKWIQARIKLNGDYWLLYFLCF